MKKTVCIPALLMLCLLCFGGCCKHQWQAADCRNPEICIHCEETQGETLSHDWQEASCAAPQTCRVCGTQQGQPLAHTWQLHGCGEPESCSVCGAEKEEPVEHVWEEATCVRGKTCRNCGLEEGELLPHSWQWQDCQTLRSCISCGVHEEKALHSWELPGGEYTKPCSHCGAEACSHDIVGLSCTQGAECSLCNLKIPAPGHDWQNDPCGSCSRCVKCQEGYSHTWKEATCADPKTCTVCGKTEEEPKRYHAFGSWEQSGEVISRSCSVCGLQDLGGVMDPADRETATSVLIGTWNQDNRDTVVLEDGTYALRNEEDTVIVIREDGTFSGNFDGEITGNWEAFGVLHYPYVTGMSRMAVNLHYSAVGKEHTVSCSMMLLQDTAGYVEADLYMDARDLHLTGKESLGESSLNIEEEGGTRSIPVGSWTSTCKTRLEHPMKKEKEYMTTEYSIKIARDGSFTAHLNKDIKGKITINSDGYYSILINGKENTDMELLFREENSLLLETTEEGVSCQYFFAQMTNGEKQDLEKVYRQHRQKLNDAVPGEWIADMYIQADVYGSGVAGICYPENGPLQLTFRDDGTFSGSILGGEATGTWFYSGVSQEPQAEAYKISLVYDCPTDPDSDYEAHWDENGLYLTMFTANGYNVIYYLQE